MIISEASIIPANFKWRAGIGQNIQQATGLGKLSKLVAKSDISNGKKTNNEFARSLLAEIDFNLTDICEKYKYDEPNVNTYNKVKSEMRQWFMNTYKKYKDHIGNDFMELLYNACIQSYTTQWVMICSNAGISDISNTEYVFSNKGIEVNPFVAYQLMDSVTKQYGINENNTIIINE